jgi:hypothetical protein
LTGNTYVTRVAADELAFGFGLAEVADALAAVGGADDGTGGAGETPAEDGATKRGVAAGDGPSPGAPHPARPSDTAVRTDTVRTRTTAPS